MGAAAALLVALGAVGCEQSKTGPTAATSATTAADAGPEQPVVDEHIAEAVESAAALEAKADAGQQGPPANGVFGPGEADKAHPAGTPLKLDLFDQGSEPRVLLAMGGAPKVPEFKVMVAMRTGQQAMPTIEYALGTKLDKVKDADAAAARSRLILTVKSVSLARIQPGAVPTGLDRRVAKLKGSKIAGELGPSGWMDEPEVTVAKGADKELGTAVEALADSLELLRVPTPDKPVGAGGYWMTVDRADHSGIEVLRYRVYRVSKVEKDQVSVHMDLRQYAQAGAIDIPGVGGAGGLNMVAFESTAEGRFTLTAGWPLPAQGQVRVPLQAQMTIENRPQEAALLQAETSATVMAKVE